MRLLCRLSIRISQLDIETRFKISRDSFRYCTPSIRRFFERTFRLLYRRLAQWHDQVKVALGLEDHGSNFTIMT